MAILGHDTGARVRSIEVAEQISVANRHSRCTGRHFAMTSDERSYSFVRLIGRRWTLRVLAELATGGQRYQDVHNVLESVSHKVLTDTLRSAERDGLIIRRLNSDRTNSPTLYELTDLGKSLDEPLAALDRWVAANWQLVEAARRNWSARTDG